MWLRLVSPAALEIVEDLPDVDCVLIPYGGGALACGIAAVLKVLLIFGGFLGTCGELGVSVWQELRGEECWVGSVEPSTAAPNAASFGKSRSHHQLQSEKLCGSCWEADQARMDRQLRGWLRWAIGEWFDMPCDWLMSCSRCLSKCGQWLSKVG